MMFEDFDSRKFFNIYVFGKQKSNWIEVIQITNNQWNNIIHMTTSVSRSLQILCIQFNILWFCSYM